jgi:pyruvate,water dikinase
MGHVLSLQEVDRARIALVGGKGALVAELSRIGGIAVPDGFCVTTGAFQRALAQAPSLDDRLDRLSRLEPDDRAAIRELGAEIRRAIEGAAVPADLASAIARRLARLGAPAAYAVRSSATIEDSPGASFAGLHETYLNVAGEAAILQHVKRCWASLFTERAVVYRMRNGLDHRTIQMAVLVQRMVFPQAAGVLFTADPITGSRRVASVEASFGLGEALVSGRVNADVYKVRDGEVVAKELAAKRLAIRALPAGGTEQQAIEPERQKQPALMDAQVVDLVRLGRRIEAHFGRPQDIEWCLVDDGLRFLQSRPITTLFPIPATDDRGGPADDRGGPADDRGGPADDRGGPADDRGGPADDPDDHGARVYVSVGHQQMMTDPMKPLGLSVFQLTALRPMHAAGGRLFVDVTRELASPAIRARVIDALGTSDPLIGDALRTLVARGDVVRPLADEPPSASPSEPPAPIERPAPIETDPTIVAALIEHTRASIAALKREIRTKTAGALLDFILADIQELKRILSDPRSRQAIVAAMEASLWLNRQMGLWLGEKNAADALTLSVAHNVTSEMGLALLDVADVVRAHPRVAAFLRNVEDDGFLDELPALAGGREVRDAIGAYLDRYGMRCVGEIDITRPRWSERPGTLLPMILGNVERFQAGAGKRRFEQRLREAREREQELLERLRGLPDGERKAGETKRMIDRVRTFAGYREYPKYGIVSRYFVYKQALLAEAERLVEAGVLREKEDMFYLTFQELHDVVRTRHADARLIRRRKDELCSYRALTPPRVLTSDGEVVAGAYRRDDPPAGALIGLPVSAGTVEGRARVILDAARADLQPGDILVTAYTDPSWTPLFVAIEGLVTEVGGLMTHGAVIAREYGLPAVVGVEHATRLIRDGQRIRVHGTDGYVEILR